MADDHLNSLRQQALARCTVNGVNPTDYMEITQGIDRWEDWCSAWSARAAVHEDLGHTALKARKFTSAAEHLCRAAVTYHFGEYLFVHDPVQQRAAHEKAVACHMAALPHLEPPGERVLIPYEKTALPAVLRKPRIDAGRPPVVLMTMGLESTKEEMVTFEATFLSRGMATLAFEGPGQGELQYALPIRHDYEEVTRPVVDWVQARDDLDGSRIGIWGISLGGYYAPRAAAYERRIKACISNCGPYDWGALWDKLRGLTRDAFRVRSHSTSDEQARIRAQLLTLDGAARLITCPLFIIAGGRDFVPAEQWKRLAAEVKGPVEVLYIEDGVHVAHNRPYRYRPQSADWMAEQLGALSL